VVIGFTPGGQPDIVTRLIAPKLGELLGQPLVVDNRPGAGGVIGTKIVADAQPDGYTLLTASSSHAVAPAIYAKLPYDSLKDIAGVSMASVACYVLVAAPALGVKTVQDLVAMAKAKPGQLNFSSAGTGSGMHFAGEVFKQAAQIDATHVPYKGVPEAMNDVVGGRVQFTMAPLGASVGLVRDGRLRGFFAPSKTPRAVINKLNRDIVRVLNDTDIQQRLATLGVDPAPTTPEQLDKFVAEQVALVMQLAKKAGIQAR
jgi:tripartite-type tricarboxylate transporter receptor subunit TctC